MAEHMHHYFVHPVPADASDDRDQRVPDWVPVADVAETPTGYLVRVELPGLGAEAIEVSVENHVLSIAGERKQEEPQKVTRYHRVEGAYGSFLRRFSLPDEVDEQQARAEFKDGLLSVHVPKSERAQPRSIEVKAA